MKRTHGAGHSRIVNFRHEQPASQPASERRGQAAETRGDRPCPTAERPVALPSGVVGT